MVGTCSCGLDQVRYYRIIFYSGKSEHRLDGLSPFVLFIRMKKYHVPINAAFLYMHGPRKMIVEPLPEVLIEWESNDIHKFENHTWAWILLLQWTRYVGATEGHVRREYRKAENTNPNWEKC